MPPEPNSLPRWILLVSGLYALIAIAIAALLFFWPTWAVPTVDLNAKGTQYLINVYGIRQMAAGALFVYAVFRQSAPMLRLAYFYIVIINMGDFINTLVMGGNQQLSALGFFTGVAIIMQVVITKRLMGNKPV